MIDQASFQSFGCETAIAVASMATELIRGKTADEALALRHDELTGDLGALPPMKIHCAQLVEGALKAALDADEAADKKTAPPETGLLKIFHVDGQPAGGSKTGSRQAAPARGRVDLPAVVVAETSATTTTATIPATASAATTTSATAATAAAAAAIATAAAAATETTSAAAIFTRACFICEVAAHVFEILKLLNRRLGFVIRRKRHKTEIVIDRSPGLKDDPVGHRSTTPNNSFRSSSVACQAAHKHFP